MELSFGIRFYFHFSDLFNKRTKNTKTRIWKTNLERLFYLFVNYHDLWYKRSREVPFEVYLKEKKGMCFDRKYDGGKGLQD